MNVIQLIKRHACLVSAVLLLVGQASFVRAQQEWLIDFGNNTTYRSISVTNPSVSDNPAAAGNYWNSLQPGVLASNLVDKQNTATTLQIGYDTPMGFDSYNGPAGDTSFGTPADNVDFTDIDQVALGDMGVKAAAFDYMDGPGTGDNKVKFEIQNLDPTKKYDLTFFGSHKYSLDATTVYSVFTDSTFTTQIASKNLNVMSTTDPSKHNRDTLATITGLSPQDHNILYVQFVGMTGHEGYLNSMRIVAEAVAPGITGDYSNDGKVSAADYVVWRNNLNTTNVLPNDPAGGTIGATQYANWRSHFGQSSGAGSGLGSAAVPEPMSMSLFAIGLLGLISSQRRGR